jgi:putative Mg2+ transporter-C (MgtC) family protein
MEVGQTLSRLGLSLLLAMPIGWEREFSHKSAGLRTHLLVSSGCCLFMLVSLYVAQVTAVGQSDPGRIAAQIVTGIGFLGGGAILRSGGAVRGLTTAASIWSVAAIGMACGCGFYAGAAAGAVGTFIVLTGLSSWERRFLGEKKRTTLRVRVKDDEAARRAHEVIEGLGMRSDATSLQSVGEERLLTVTGLFQAKAVSTAFQELAEDRDVLGVERHEG